MSDYTPRKGDWVRRTITVEGQVEAVHPSGYPYLRREANESVTVEPIDPPMPPLPDHGVIRVQWKPDSEYAVPSPIFTREEDETAWVHARIGWVWTPEHLAGEITGWVELVEKAPG